ncbi:MAG: hypothetical protein WEB06_12655 [Actinomycetota bacterium]
MRTIIKEDIPVVIKDDNVELRIDDIGGMTVGFVQLKAGTDLSGATVGLPDDLCPCPHWGRMLKGRLKMKTIDGDKFFEAGDVFYWGPGHAPIALEDCEYVDFSPTKEFAAVIRHLKGEA